MRVIINLFDLPDWVVRGKNDGGVKIRVDYPFMLELHNRFMRLTLVVVFFGITSNTRRSDSFLGVAES